MVVGADTGPSTTRASPPGTPTILLPHQPIPVVIGERDVPTDDCETSAPQLHLRTRDPDAVLAELPYSALDRQHVFLEGGPTLAAAFLKAGLVDETSLSTSRRSCSARPAVRGRRPGHQHDRRQA